VFVTSPSYVGTCGDVAALSAVTRAAGVPLVVDAAWGAHLGSRPDLPPHPLVDGADAVVTSTHKTLPALNQGAVVLARTRFLDPERLGRAMEAGATTSPSGAILASIDGALAMMAAQGDDLVGALLERVRRARDVLREVPGLVVPDASSFGERRFDDAKLVLAPYPPGVPLLAPGEEITTAALDSLQQAKDEGARIAYAADPTLATVLAVRR
jgi:lysine decarboxylase